MTNRAHNPGTTSTPIPLIVFAFGMSLAFGAVFVWAELTGDPQHAQWANMLGGASLLSMLMAFLAVRRSGGATTDEEPAIARQTDPDSEMLRLLDPRRARQFTDQPDTIAPVHDAEQQRRTGRLRVTSIRSSIGEVEDLSPSGIRLFVTSRRGFTVGKQRQVMLRTEDATVEVTLEIIWVEPARRGQRVGGRFVDLTPEAREALSALAVRGCDPHLV